MFLGIKIQSGYEKNTKAKNQKTQVMLPVIDDLTVKLHSSEKPKEYDFEKWEIYWTYA